MSLHPGFLNITHGCEIIKAWESQRSHNTNKARRVQNKVHTNQIPLPYPGLELRATVLKSGTQGPLPQGDEESVECDARALRLLMIRTRPRFAQGLAIKCQQPLSYSLFTRPQREARCTCCCLNHVVKLLHIFISRQVYLSAGGQPKM